MRIFKEKLSPISILMMVIAMAALATWLIPAGRFDTLEYKAGHSLILKKTDQEINLPFTQQTLDSLHILVKLEKFREGGIRRPVSVPGTYHSLPANRQSFLSIFKAPIMGITETIDIILFVLFIGGFIHIFNGTGAMEKGLIQLSRRMHGKEAWLIIILSFLFSFGGASFGMAEEGFAFYAILVPLFLAAGYDLLVPVAVIFGGTQLGTLSSFSNPFSTIIASNAAGVSWTDGMTLRLTMFVISTAIFIWYVASYANKVKRDPTASLVYKIDGVVDHPFKEVVTSGSVNGLDKKTIALLLVFLATFLVMIGGVIFLEWWLPEMTLVFLLGAILIAVIKGMREKAFITSFIKGAEGFLSVAFIIGVARGITIVLNEGNISDTIVFHAANIVSTMPRSMFMMALLIFFLLFTLFISSTSGMAVVTMPIMGSLATLTGVAGSHIVNSYLFGMGIMGLISPTGLILPSLAMTNISMKTWIRFIWPLLVILFVVCSVALVLDSAT